MKLSRKKILIVLSVASIAVVLFGTGFIETCDTKLVSAPPDDPRYNNTELSVRYLTGIETCSSFWSSDVKLLDSTCEKDYKNFKSLLNSDNFLAYRTYLPQCMYLTDGIDLCTGLEDEDFTFEFFKENYCEINSTP